MTRRYDALVLLWLLVATLAQAQVTQDDVNAIARRMYCPVCENIPLSDCGTPTCIQWREEIRLQLLEGRTADEIIADFVARFGQHVVGLPQDEGLRAFALITPLLAVVALMLASFLVLRRWQSPQKLKPSTSDESQDDLYYQQLERDLGLPRKLADDQRRTDD